MQSFNAGVYIARRFRLAANSMEVVGESNGLTEDVHQQQEATPGIIANRARGQSCTPNGRLIVRLLWVLLSLLLVLGAALGFVDVESLERLRPVLVALVREGETVNGTTF